VLFTGELPDRNNQFNISRIPAGTYAASWVWSSRFGRYTYRLAGTAPRSGVLIHPANFMGDTAKGYLSQLNGCIALGEKVGLLLGQKALLRSVSAVSRLEDLMQHKPFTLEIIDRGQLFASVKTPPGRKPPRAWADHIVRTDEQS